MRWMHSVKNDLRKLRCRNWKLVAQDRTTWRHVLKEAKAHPELSANDDDDVQILTTIYE